MRLQYKENIYIQFCMNYINYVERHDTICFRYYGQYKDIKDMKDMINFTVYSKEDSSDMVDIKIKNNMVSINGEDYIKFIKIPMDDENFSQIINKKCIFVSTFMYDT